MQHSTDAISENFLSRLWSNIKAQPDAAPVGDPTTVTKNYKHWRARILYASFIGYAIYYFCRKNLSASTPALIADLHLTKAQIGSMWSALYLTYGVSKFANGILGDRANPRYFMAIGLVLSAIMNICFGLSYSVVTLTFFWALNGWVQGMGWPPCARLLTQWYSPSERATKWAFWSTSHSVGAALILVLAGYLAQHYGWRSSFIIPSIIALITAVFLVDRLRDSPQSLGLPEVEKFRNDPSPTAENDQANLPFKEILVRYVFKNPMVWLLAIGNFFVYLVRYGALDWSPTFLVEVKHASISLAATKTAVFEVLGILGTLVAGYISDKYFKNFRWVVNFGFMALLIVSLILFWKVPAGNTVLDIVALGASGFLVYGPQLMVGVCAVDVTTKRAAATVTGFTGLFGYLGSIASGAGTGWIVDHFGWNGGFIFFILSAIIGTFCFLLTGLLHHKKTPAH